MSEREYVYEYLKNLFKSLENKNFTFDRKVKLFQGKKTIQVSLNDYVWYFFQGMSYLNFYELNFKKFMNHKIKGNWIKNFLLENMYIDFENNNNFSYKFHPDQNYKKYHEEIPLETKFISFFFMC